MSKLFVQVDRVEDLIHMTGDYFTPPKQKPKQKPKTITNADRIRSMSDEELAELISERIDCSECEHMYAGDGKPCHNGKTCPDYWLDWLKKEEAAQ